MTNDKPVSIWEALGFVWELIVMIAVPTIALALAGRWVDQRFHTTPWVTLAGLLLALLICVFIVRRKALAIAFRLKQRP
ncbi:MAG TPA: AtpZ/AtpI family protein [Candidatus Methylomirabilis sp.]|nr:AtpZ/AtpI family protein [Candidatus Methylomirabilis sp.]